MGWPARSRMVSWENQGQMWILIVILYVILASWYFQAEQTFGRGKSELMHLTRGLLPEPVSFGFRVGSLLAT